MLNILMVCFLVKDVSQNSRGDVLGMGQGQMITKETRHFLPIPPAQILLEIAK